MAVQLFTGNVIAVIWDFDQTLIPGYQQAPLFEMYGVDEGQFWAEVNKLSDHYARSEIVVSKDTVYLNHILTYIKHGKFKGLNNKKLRELGSRLSFYEGMPDLMAKLKDEIESDETFAKHDIRVEHYVVSTGLRQMILGSAIAEHVEGVWACEFIETPAPPGYLNCDDGDGATIEEPEICQVGYFLDNTTKTRAIWEINKGTNKDPKVEVNSFIAPADRRVPTRNMVYVADGPSDIPVFSILNQFGGKTLGVYNPKQPKHYAEVKNLGEQSRVQHFTRADYSAGSDAALWLTTTLRKIADLVVRDRAHLLSTKVGKSASHVVE